MNAEVERHVEGLREAVFVRERIPFEHVGEVAQRIAVTNRNALGNPSTA